MTALRKFLPSEDKARAFQTFVHALNTPIPSDVLAVMRIEEFLRSNSVYALRLLPQSISQMRSEAITAPRAGGAT